MSQKKLKLSYSKSSLVWRICLSLVLIGLIFVVIFLRVPISKWIYHWDDSSVENADFCVEYIDVGQGDSSLIKFDDGKTMLIDCGPKASSATLVRELKNQNVETIDYFLLTHPDADHVGGGAQIFSEFNVKNFYRPMFLSASEEKDKNYPIYSTAIYDEVISAFYREQGALQFFTNVSLPSIKGENYVVNFLAPIVVNPDPNQTDTNALSAVVDIKLNGQSFLFMADAESEQERELVQTYGGLLKTNVLKVGHHGSSTSTTKDLLEKAQPQYAIISCGKNNSYGHPSSQTVERLEQAQAKIYQTSLLGNIIFSVKDGVLYPGGEGKMIDYALISVLLGVGVLLVWGIHFPKRKNKSKKSS